jgi:hypothetical protein
MRIWPFRSRDSRTEFWSWFNRNRERLHGVGPNNRELFFEVSKRVKKVHPGLVTEFAMSDGRAVEIVISADGNKSVFPEVLELTAAAPTIPGWKVTAFRQPGKQDVTVQMGNGQLNAKSLWFRAEPDEEKVGLRVFIPGLDEGNRQQLSHIGFLLLDNALGEFLVETSVGYIDFQPAPADPEAEGCLPFPSIADHVKQLVQ